MVSVRTPVSAACRATGHVLEGVADPGYCSLWQVYNHPLSPRAFPPYALCLVSKDHDVLVQWEGELLPHLLTLMGAEHSPLLSVPCAVLTALATAAFNQSCGCTAEPCLGVQDGLECMMQHPVRADGELALAAGDVFCPCCFGYLLML